MNPIRCVALGLLVATPLASQGRPCRDCVIATHVVRLEIDKASPSVVADAFTEILRLTTGEYIVGPVNSGRGIAVFASSGRFLRTVGRSGGGPGEFKTITRIFKGAGDSTLVYDAGTRRLSVLSPTLTFVRSIPLPDHRKVVHVNGLFVGTGVVRSRDQFGNAVHVYSAKNGALYRTFRGSARTATADSVRLPSGIASDAKGRLWIYDGRDGTLSIEDADGRAHHSVRYKPLWHDIPVDAVPKTSSAQGRGELPAVPGSPRRPFSGISAIEVISPNVLLVLGSVPRKGWEAHPSPFGMAKPEARRLGSTRLDYGELTTRLNDWFETRVDLADFSGGAARTIGTARLPFGRAIPLGNGHVAGFGAHEDGSLFADIWLVRSSAPRGKPQ